MSCFRNVGARWEERQRPGVARLSDASILLLTVRVAVVAIGVVAVVALLAELQVTVPAGRRGRGDTGRVVGACVAVHQSALRLVEVLAVRTATRKGGNDGRGRQRNEPALREDRVDEAALREALHERELLVLKVGIF